MSTIAMFAQSPEFPRFLAAHLPPTFQEALGRQPAGGRADLAVVAPDLGRAPRDPLPCRVLLLPGTLAHLARAIPAAWVVSYGLSSRDTLTLSSLSPPCLTLQRELVTLTGRCLEPQEIPLPRQLHTAPLPLLAWAGTALLLGVPAEDLAGLL